ncbi:hypothetical protein N0V82_010156 [Gnomoniopsis sp. IMI 355080]|nr:hypothetical protein N0V82_010156 [Gnomoniopsis sp. IMI 355080]
MASATPLTTRLSQGIAELIFLKIQCIMHIIINRIALIMCDSRRVRRLKWIVTLLIGAINISVFIIWMPARLQINSNWIYLNDIWDRVEKGIFLLIDLGLNLYFIYLVRSELIGHGLKKYWNLYWFNISMIFISISLDFHPLMYLIKLKIEMNMADLIIKIVKATSPAPGHELHRYAATGSVVHQPQRLQDHDIESRDNTESTSNTNKTTIPFSHSQTDILGQAESIKLDKINKQDNGWVLSRLPSNFDAGDVVDIRKTSVAEGSVGMVPFATLMRPPLMRNMSEMTELEIRAGYLNRDVRNGRTSGTTSEVVEQSPV